MTGLMARRMCLAAAAVLLMTVRVSHAQLGACIVGQPVLVDPGNHPGTVLAASGGSCRVHYADGAYPDGWTYTFNIKRANAGTQAAASTGPRLGRYDITVGKGLSDGTLVLSSDSTYELLLPGGKSWGTGRYAFDAANMRVRWLSGPLTDPTWDGTQKLEAHGAMVQIRIGARAVATNTGN